MYSPSIQKLIALLSKFPTVGPRTAGRFVFYLLKLPKEEITELVNSIATLKEKVKICSICFKSFEGENEICDICSDVRRDKTLLCVVEKESDLATIEKTKKYNGLYFIFPCLTAGREKTRANEFLARAKSPEIQEIIIALNPTAAGETMTLYLERTLKPLNKKITRLGRGLPVGGELEYADDETLGSALEGRK